MAAMVWHRMLHRVILLSLLLSRSLLAGDQLEKPAQAPEPATILKSRSELVVVPVVVTDKTGNHVSGLKKEDFIVQENGVEQNVTFFDEVTTNTQRLTRTKPHDNTFSNILPGEPTTHRVTIIILDLLNTKFQDQNRLRGDLIKFLSDLDATEPTALYVLTQKGLKVIHDFSTDPKVLIEAVHKLKGSTAQVSDNGANQGESTELEEVLAETAAFQQAIDDGLQNLAAFQRHVSIQITLEAMQQLAKAYTGLPGRKSLVWATGSFPFSISDTSMGLAPAGRDSLEDILPLYERTWQAINDANFAIYPIDARGLMASPQLDASRRGTGQFTSRNLRGLSSAANWTQSDSLATLSVIASATGGKAYYNSNDIAEGFREAAKDSSAYYLLSYYLDHKSATSGWHKLDVKVKHEKVHIRARSGFFVTPSTSDFTSLRKAEMVAALNSPLDYTEVPLNLSWTKFSPAKDPGKQTVDYQVIIPRNGATVDETDHNHVFLEFISLARTPDGKPFAQTMQILDTHLRQEILDQGNKAVFRYRNSIELPNGEYTVRFVVRDVRSGRMGSVAAALKLAGPNK
jgi:VWFA-related protein